MISKRSYLFRAMYEWILDNHFTPHIVVDTTAPGVDVPPGFIEDNKITLNLAPQAVTGFAMNNEGLEFKASFGGRLRHLYVPMASIIVVYAQENNHCLMFGASDIQKGIVVNMEEPEQVSNSEEPPDDPNRPAKRPPKFSIVK